jgi:hypothetical protein
MLVKIAVAFIVGVFSALFSLSLNPIQTISSVLMMELGLHRGTSGRHARWEYLLTTKRLSVSTFDEQTPDYQCGTAVHGRDVWMCLTQKERAI